MLFTNLLKDLIVENSRFQVLFDKITIQIINEDLFVCQSNENVQIF
jgi:hypothetical protein